MAPENLDQRIVGVIGKKIRLRCQFDCLEMGHLSSAGVKVVAYVFSTQSTGWLNAQRLLWLKFDKPTWVQPNLFCQYMCKVTCRNDNKRFKIEMRASPWLHYVRPLSEWLAVGAGSLRN